MRKFGSISQYSTIFQFTSVEWQIMEGEGIEKILFPQFENRKGIKKNIPRLRKREGNGKKNILKIQEREGNEKKHSQNSGTGRK